MVEGVLATVFSLLVVRLVKLDGVKVFYLRVRGIRIKGLSVVHQSAGQHSRGWWPAPAALVEKPSGLDNLLRLIGKLCVIHHKPSTLSVAAV
jgi:hypothetical protein